MLLPLLVEHLTDDAIAGIVVAMFYTGQLTAPIWGKLADETRKLGFFYLAGYILLGIATFCFGFVKNEAFWVILAFLQGVGAGSTNTIAAMFIVEFNPKSEWNGKIGWLQCFYGIGQALGLVLAAACSFEPFYGLIISGLLMIPGFFLGRNNNFPTEKHKHAPKVHNHNHGLILNIAHPFSLLSHFHPPTLESLSKFLKNCKNAFGLFILIWTLNNFARSLIYALLPIMMKKVFGIHPGISSLSYAIAAGICVFLYSPSGTLSNKFKPVNVSFLGTIVSTTGIILLAILAFCPKEISSYAAPFAFMIIPIAWAPLIVSGTTTATELSPIPEGSAIGIFNSSMAIGIIFSALVAGAIGLSMGYKVVLVLAALISITAIILSICLLAMGKPKTTKKAEESNE